MAEDMRLKEVVGQAMLLSTQRLKSQNGTEDGSNINQIRNDQADNFTTRYPTVWPTVANNTTDFVISAPPSDILTNSALINNNISPSQPEEEDLKRRRFVSDSLSASSPDESFGDYEGQSSSSLDVSPQGDEYHCFSQEDLTDSDFSDDGNCSGKCALSSKGIVNPNYPGFQNFASDLQDSEAGSSDEDSDSKLNILNSDNNNGNAEKLPGSEIDLVNHVESVENFQKTFYDKPKFSIVKYEDCVFSVNELTPQNSFNICTDDGQRTERERNVAKEVAGSFPSGNTIENNIPQFNRVISFDTHFEPFQTENYLEKQGSEGQADSGIGSDIATDSDFDCQESCLNYTPQNRDYTDSLVKECIVETAVFPVSGIVETTIIRDDESDSSPSPTDENFNQKFIQDSEAKSTMNQSFDTQDCILQINETDSLVGELIMADKVDDSNKLEGPFVTEMNQSQKHDAVNPLTAIQDKNVLSDSLKMENRTQAEAALKDSYKIQIREKYDKKSFKETGKRFEDLDVVRKRDKTEINFCTKRNLKMSHKPESSVFSGSDVVQQRGKEKSNLSAANRRSLPLSKEKLSALEFGLFDVYNIETAMPQIDLEVIESHLKAAKEEERRRRNDREEIRRRLAMGTDGEDYLAGERSGRKPSLQSRLQSGMNLQICFMNETISDNESPNSDTENIKSSSTSTSNKIEEKSSARRPVTLPVNASFETLPHNHIRPSTSLLTLPLRKENELKAKPMTEADFFACQAQLQAEARQALSQAKEMAHMQMEVEKQQLKTSPITEMVRCSLEKVGIPFPEDRRRLSRQILTEMNVAQLQVIVNDLHTQIETLNEGLVKFLIDRDDLHMEQDSMLVDIEDLTRYLGGKEKPPEIPNMIHLNNNINRTPGQRVFVGDSSRL